MRRNNFTGTLSRSILIKKLDDDNDLKNDDGAGKIPLDRFQSLNGLKGENIDPVMESLLYQKQYVPKMSIQNTSIDNKNQKDSYHFCKLNMKFKDTILENLAQRYFQNTVIHQKANRFEKIIIERPRIDFNCKYARRNIFVPSNKSNCEINCAINEISQTCNENKKMRPFIAATEFDATISRINCALNEEIKQNDPSTSQVVQRKCNALWSNSNSNNNIKQAVKKKSMKKANVKSSLSTLQNIRLNEGKQSSKAKNINSTAFTPQLRALVKSLKITKNDQSDFDNVHMLKDIHYTKRMMEIATMNNDYLKNLKQHYIIYQKNKGRKHKKSKKRKPLELCKTKTPKAIQKNSLKPKSEWNAIVFVE